MKRLPAVLSVLVFLGLPALAAGQAVEPRSQDGQHKGIAAVTDGPGNPVDLESAAAGSVASRPKGESGPTYVRRGQAWWPFAEALPPYAPVDQRVESMVEDEIQVNGVATLHVGNPTATLALVPKELL